MTTTTTPVMGKSPAPMSADKQKLIGLIAVAFGCFATFVILQYALENLNTLGLEKSVKEVRSYDIYLLIFAHVFIFFIGGMIAYQHPSLRFWLMILGIGIFVYDFASTYQARMGIVQQQSITQDAQKEHAKMLGGQAEASQAAARQLQQSAARQLANKHITGSAKTATEAARQADKGAKMVEDHAKTIANLHPTEADVWGEWTSKKMFIGAALVHLVNLAMWTLAGVMFGAGTAHAHASTTETPAHDRSTFAGRAAAAGVVGGAALGGAGMAHAEQPPVVKYWGAMPSGGVPVSVHPNAITAPESVHTGVSKSVHQKRVRTAGMVDTGIEGAAGTRYTRIKEAVQSGNLKPSIRAIKRAEGGSQDVVMSYITQLEKEGVVAKDGRGWKVVSHA